MMHIDVSPLNVSIAVITLAATLWMCWKSWQRSRDRRWAGVLETLRVLLICMAVMTIFQPEFVREELPDLANVIHVLCDDSPP